MLIVFNHCCMDRSFDIRRRKVLQTSLPAVILTSIVRPVRAEQNNQSCEYFKFTNKQAKNIRQTYEEEDNRVYQILEKIENSHPNVNFIYTKGSENTSYFYETGNNNREDMQENTWIGFALRVNSLVDFDTTPEAVELDNPYLQSYDLDPDCSRIPFERDFEVDITSSPSNPKQGDSVILEAIPSEINSDHIANYEWDIGDDGSVDDTGQTISTEFNQERTSVSVTTTTDVGTMGEASTIITASPSVIITPTFEYQPSTPVAGDPITFDATGSTAEDTDIRTYEWDFTGDGTTDATGEKAVHTFDEGKYQVSLIIRGADGTEQTTSQVVEVIDKRVKIAVTTTDTQLTVDEQVTIQYSVNNYLTSEELTVQLLIETPSGVAVSGVSGAQEGSNQFTAVTTLSPGRQEQIRINLTANSPGTYTVTAVADYYFGNDQQSGDRITEQLSFTVDPRGESGDTGGNSSTDSNATGFGLSSGLSAIVGVSYILKQSLIDSDSE